jgi:hypothetical protein
VRDVALILGGVPLGMLIERVVGDSLRNWRRRHWKWPGD